ncbi:MAG: single-stranded-DNA-specific exonuclease RecJ [Pseudomonadota bacterium]
MADRRHFLGVKNSVSGQPWFDRLDEAGIRRAETIGQRHDLSDFVSRIVAGRVEHLDDVSTYLAPTVRDLMPDPKVMLDMESAVERVAHALAHREQIAIFGDYDVDGATSAAILHRVLKAFGSTAPIYIPDRIFEGYGPNQDALTALKESGATLLVCVDCGTSSHDALAHAQKIGLDVVVIDHHQPSADLPHAAAIVNPNRDDDVSGLGSLCAAGLVFMFVVALNRAMRETENIALGQNQMLALLPFVALGTVCDVVPLKGLNRAFTRTGLKAMARRENAGLTALSDVARLDGPPTPYHLGFVLGPRINAGGRIGQADLGATLLTSDEPDQALRIASELNRLNLERQAVERAMLETAILEVEQAIGSGPPPDAIVSGHTDWHPGVVGLVASRLKDRFKRPSFAIAFRGDRGTGSARSIPGVNVGAILRKAVENEIAEKGGGHAMAAGFTINRERLPEFRAFLEAESAIASADAEPNGLTVDAALTAGGATVDTIDMMAVGEPYGSGNPDPVIAMPAHRVRKPSAIKGGHIRCGVVDGAGRSVQAICFRAADTPLGDMLMSASEAIHVAGSLRVDRWGGNRRVQLHIRDAAKVTG